MDAGKTILSVFFLLVAFGAVIQILRAPQSANTLIGATSTTIVGLTHTLEGRAA